MLKTPWTSWLKTQLSDASSAGFYLFLALHVVGIAALPYFVSLDGPGHIYTSLLASELIAGTDFFSTYFHFSTFPNPNGLANFLLMGFSRFISGPALEKGFILVYTILFVLGFRKFVHQWLPKKKNLSWLAFLFVFHGILVLGFHNFNLGIALFWWACAGYGKFSSTPSWKNTWPMVVWCFALYFSHLVIFGLFGVFVFAHFLSLGVCAVQQKKLPFYAQQKGFIFCAIAFLPTVLLSFFYLTHDSESQQYQHLSLEQLGALLQDFAPLSVWQTEEKTFFVLMLYILAAAVVSSVIFLFYRKKGLVKSDFHFTHFYFLLLIALVFLLPDHSTGGGELTRRLLYFLAVFAVLSVFQAMAHRAIRRWALALVMLVHVWHVSDVWKNMKSYAPILDGIMAASEYIEPNEMMLTFNWSNNWLFAHTSKYIGAEKRLLMPSHLGGTKLYSPVQWKEEYRRAEPVECMGTFYEWACNLHQLENNLKKRTRYFMVFVECDNQTMYTANCNEWNTFLADSCTLRCSFYGDWVKLYERKEP
jgi:hypothetical protein